MIVASQRPFHTRFSSSLDFTVSRVAVTKVRVLEYSSMAHFRAPSFTMRASGMKPESGGFRAYMVSEYGRWSDQVEYVSESWTVLSDVFVFLHRNRSNLLEPRALRKVLDGGGWTWKLCRPTH